MANDLTYRELPHIFNCKFRKLSDEDRLSVQLAVTAFAQAYIDNQNARINGLTKEGYEAITDELLCTDANGNAVFAEANAARGLELLIELQGCAPQGGKPERYAPTQLGDKAIMYTLGMAMAK
jgi:hypothetical protein